MNKIELIEKIKLQLKSLVSSKFAEIKAGDLMISSPDEELIIGSEVYTIDQDGNNIPLADGDYTLDSGIVVSVLAGKVAELSTKEEEVADEAGEEVEVEAEDVVEEEAPAKEEVEAEEEAKPEEEVMARLAKLEEIVKEMSKKFEEVEKEKEEMKVELSKMSETPSRNSIEVKPTEFKSAEAKKSDAGRPDITSIREKIRNNR